MHGLVAFLIFALIIIVIAWIILKVIALIPGLPAPVMQILPLIVGVIVFIALIDKALPLLGMGGVW